MNEPPACDRRSAPSGDGPETAALTPPVLIAGAMIARARVISSHAETPTTHTVRIAKPPGFDFRPVQFVGLEISTAEGSQEYPMSLASSPTRDYLEFGARLSSSPWKNAFAALRPGDEVEVDGPYGHFVLDETRPAVFIAGGIGITPLKGMLQYATDKRLPLDLRLVYSNRSPDEIAYRQELEALVQANPSARVVHTLTRADGASGWNGLTGRVDSAMIQRVAAGLPDPGYYVCGRPEMVEDVVHLLRGLGVARGRILYEQFWGYQ